MASRVVPSSAVRSCALNRRMFSRAMNSDIAVIRLSSVGSNWPFDPEGRRRLRRAAVEKFVETVGRERCLIVVFDDLARDPEAEYERILRFIDLEGDGRTDFGVHRASRGYRFGFLQRLLKRPPKALRGIAAGSHYRQRIRSLEAPSAPSKLTQVILTGRKRLLRWNSAEALPVSLDKALRQNIRERLESDVKRLAGIIDRDLRHWVRT